MTFLSYAQNYEDLVLFRALQSVQCGFYIDVGAQDPIEDSVTRAFYERGWRGINIDPAEHWHRKLQQDRPSDINLRVAASDHRGMLHFYDVAETGLSTSSQEFAAQHRGRGRRISEYEVECLTLDDICAEYQVGEIHFLKIDAEGAEGAVLRGLSLDKIRPWIIVIEAMLPNSQIPAWGEWHPLLDAQGYACVYEDGLNRFYLAPEHRELKEAFRFPPNILDDFTQHRTVAALDYLHGENSRREAALVELRSALQQSLSTQIVLEQERSAVEQKRDALEQKRKALEEELTAAHDALRRADCERSQLRSDVDRMLGENASLNAALIAQHEEMLARDQIIAHSTEAIQALRTSTSWRITAPLRWTAAGMGSARRSAAVAVLRPLARFARPALRKLAQIGWLRVCLTRLLDSDSQLAVRARWFLFGPPVPPATRLEPAERMRLTRSALRVLGEINKRKHVGEKAHGRGE